MTVQANNMEVYLHIEIQRRGGAVPLATIIRLYDDFAPGLTALGEGDEGETLGHTTFPDGIHRYILTESSEIYGESSLSFMGQMGFVRFRNRRYIDRRDWRLSETDRMDREDNLYQNLARYV